MYIYINSFPVTVNTIIIYHPSKSITEKMSQQQPQRPQQEQPIKYGDVFDVSGQLSSQPIAPNDASAMQAAENMVLGKTQKGGPASVMQSAAAVNLQHGVVGRDEGTPIATEQGVTISEAQIAGSRIITEAVGGQVHIL